MASLPIISKAAEAAEAALAYKTRQKKWRSAANALNNCLAANFYVSSEAADEGRFARYWSTFGSA